MSIVTDIASASINLSELKFKQAVDIAMLKKSIEMQELQAEFLINDLPGAAPQSGSIIDVKA
jgi:hypothetical protein